MRLFKHSPPLEIDRSQWRPGETPSTASRDGGDLGDYYDLLSPETKERLAEWRRKKQGEFLQSVEEGE